MKLWTILSPLVWTNKNINLLLIYIIANKNQTEMVLQYNKASILVTYIFSTGSATIKDLIKVLCPERLHFSPGISLKLPPLDF